MPDLARVRTRNEGHVLVLDDNSANSQDGHFWAFLPMGEILGRAWWRFWPMDGFRPLASATR